MGGMHGQESGGHEAIRFLRHFRADDAAPGMGPEQEADLVPAVRHAAVLHADEKGGSMGVFGLTQGEAVSCQFPEPLILRGS